VGKTSIARSIARTLGRKFVSMSLGGVHDEAEIRGHRRTYIGAVPGRVLYHLKQSGTTNPVFLFDEIDKMGSGIHGDPASAMLEVLDPEQNKDFRDNYLELPFDLSKVLFLTTANSLDTVPAPLLDRMEVIELSGYTDYEKEQIALRYLVDKQARASGLGEKGITFSPDALQTLIHRYTRESGVRNLEREIASSMRKLALKEVDGRLQTPHEVTGEEVLALLGKPPFCDTEARLSDEVGVCNGLAWTSAGGKTLEIEVTLTPGKGEVLLTGRLGDVMKESAYAALTLVQSRGAQYGVDTARFETCDVHLHVPEGATPKDGPSAGVAIATAVMSAFSGRAVRHDVAMTGEVTLRGAVLPIGGLKEKLLAAYRAGITTVIIPQENEKDLDEIPADIRAVLTIVTATSVETVFSVALVQA
jgi:ATP-dependent Lon protease